MRWVIIILVALGAVAFFTNPTEDDLRVVLSQFVGAKVDEKMDQMAPPPEALPGPLSGLRARAREAMAPAITNAIGVTRNNYYLFSVFHLDVPPVPMEKEPPKCLIGAFKAVFIPLSSC